MSSSSYTMTRPGTGSGRGGADIGGGGSVTSSHSPAGTRSDLAAGRPLTSTDPSLISSAPLARDKPNSRASAASRRSPSSPPGTGTPRLPDGGPRPRAPGHDGSRPAGVPAPRAAP